MRKKVTITAFSRDLISRSKNGFKASVYHKPAFTVIYCNFNSLSTSNIKLVWFYCYFEHFQLSLTLPGFIRKSVI